MKTAITRQARTLMKFENYAPYQLFKGERVQAEYKEQVIPMYANNPLIEALPPIQLTDDFIRSVAMKPPYYPDKRILLPEHRLHLISAALECFTPLSFHVEWEQKISRMIRTGYVNRNPASRAFVQDLDFRVGKVAAEVKNSSEEAVKYSGRM